MDDGAQAVGQDLPPSRTKTQHREQALIVDLPPAKFPRDNPQFRTEYIVDMHFPSFFELVCTLGAHFAGSLPSTVQPRQVQEHDLHLNSEFIPDPHPS